MRQLHPVSFHEQFVASGTYTFYQANAATGDVEQWTMHEPGAGSYTVRADRDGRDGTGINWLFEGLYLYGSDGGHVERFDVDMLDASPPAVTRYLFGPGAVEVTATVGGKRQPGRRIKLPAGTAALPMAQVLSYRGISEAARAGAASLRAFVPIPAGILPDHFGGILRHFRVEPLGEDAMSIGATAYSVAGYAVEDRDTGDRFTCWFDAHDILLSFDDGREQIVLTEYAHRPDGAT